MNTYLFHLVSFIKQGLYCHTTLLLTVFARANSVIKRSAHTLKIYGWTVSLQIAFMVIPFKDSYICSMVLLSHGMLIQVYNTLAVPRSNIRRVLHDYQMFRCLQAMQLPKSAAQYEWLLCRIYLCSFNFAALAITKYDVITVLSTNQTVSFCVTLYSVI
jgi:hypothetical protein